MARLLKVLLMIAGAAVGLLLLAAVLVATLFDPNDYKPQIESEVQERTGRAFQIEGDLELAFFPWLSITSGPAALGNAPGFGDEPFARIDGFSAGIRLWPLLRGETEIGQVRLQGMRLDLEVDAEGRNNWADLVPEADPAAPPAEDPLEALRALRVDGVEVRSASVRYRDASAGQAFALEDFDLALSELLPGEPMDAQFSARLLQEEPSLAAGLSGRSVVLIDLENGRLQLEDVRLDADLEGGADAPLTAAAAALRIGGVEISLDRQPHHISQLELGLNVQAPDLPAGGIDLRLAVATLQADPGAGTAALEAVELETLGIELRATVQASGLDQEAPAVQASFEVPEFSPRQTLAALAADYAPRDDSALGAAAARGELRLNGAGVEVSALELRLDETELGGWLRHAGRRLEFELAAGEIDLDRYLPPDEETEAGETALDEVEIPVETLRELAVDGQLRVAAARVAGLELTDLALGVRAENGRWRLDPLEAGLYDGRYLGDIRLALDGDEPVLTVDDRLENVQIGALALALFEQQSAVGRVDASLQLAAVGRTVGALRRTLDGEISLSLREGAWEGVDLEYELRRAAALVRQQPVPARAEGPERTEFQDVRMSAVIEDGLLRSDDLNARLRFMELHGEGVVDLADGTLDYALEAEILDHPDLEQLPLLAQLTGLALPLRITGPLTGPGVQADLAGMIREEGLGRLREEVLERLLPREEAQEEADEDPEADDAAPDPQDLLRRGVRELLRQ